MVGPGSVNHRGLPGNLCLSADQDAVEFHTQGVKQRITAQNNKYSVCSDLLIGLCNTSFSDVCQLAFDTL